CRWTPITSVKTRAGTAYVAIVATALLAATISMGALAVVRAQTRHMDLVTDAAEARWYAMSGLELGRLWIAQDANWRSTRPHGVWVSNQPIGKGSFTLEVTDPGDGNLADHPHDSILMVATGFKGSARQSIEVTLKAEATPLEILKYALHTGGQLHIRASKLLTATGATVSTNGSLRNDGTIDANVETATVINSGIVKGTLKAGVLPKAGVDPSVVERYANMGVEISPGSTIHERVLAPGYTPYGKTHPDGVYVVRSSCDLWITETRIHGTLVVICPGKRVILSDQVFLKPARDDYPALIVNGNVLLQYDSSSTLSESALWANFNPPGAPYNGVGDYDYADEYPNEVQGLIHATGTVEVTQNAVVRGAIIAESNAITDAADWNAYAKIVYNPAIYLTPPPYYTTIVKMIPVAGSWKQRVR
ncbi:MAG TPA: hypothetical protein VHP11_15130, partial [Tepidisphaeraceae bacterium]|nr:hypothetical protein [Tepidisphaeraceae bacterium]